MKINTEDDLKAVPGLRWRLDEDRTPIATSVCKARARDHLYFHGPGKLGIYLERKNAISFGGAWRHYAKTIEARGGTILTQDCQLGDADGTLVFLAPSSKTIPRLFLTSQRGYASRPAP